MRLSKNIHAYVRIVFALLLVTIIFNNDIIKDNYNNEEIDVEKIVIEDEFSNGNI